MYITIPARTCRRPPKLDLRFEQLLIYKTFSESGKSSHIFGPRNASESFPCSFEKHFFYEC